MADGSLARRYARALVDLGQSESHVDRFASDLEDFAQVMALGDGALLSALTNPGVTMAERKAVLGAVLGKANNLHEYTRNFLNLLVDKNRFGYFPAIHREYSALADELAHRVRATVTTAKPLDQILRGKVEKALAQSTGKTVVVTFEEDPDLIGGLVAKVGDKVFDASVRTRLHDIQQSLLRDPVAEA